MTFQVRGDSESAAGPLGVRALLLVRVGHPHAPRAEEGTDRPRSGGVSGEADRGGSQTQNYTGEKPEADAMAGSPPQSSQRDLSQCGKEARACGRGFWTKRGAG